MNYYYSDPYPTPKKKDEDKKSKAYQSNFAVDKMSGISNKKVETIPFHTEKLAWDFLETKNIYVNGVLCYTGK